MMTEKTHAPDERLKRLLGGPELLPLRRRMRRFFEWRDSDHGKTTLHLTKLSTTEHEALSLLIGRPSGFTRSMRIDIGQLDAALRHAGIAASLREALELIDGAIENRLAIKQDRLLRWTRLTGASHLHPAIGAWLQTAAAVGLLKRMARQNPDAAEQLLAQAHTVLKRLPANGITRAQLAAEALGNAHALDSGRAIAALVLAVWRHSEDGAEASQETDIRQCGDRPRDIWARAGVLVNELARPALFLNLPTAAQTPVSCFPGQPSYLSLRQLLRTPPDWAVAGLKIFVCENPNLVAMAADRLGADCAPLVCTDGMPAAAQRTLLTQLARAGAELGYHGDFDWPGIRIANHVMNAWRAFPWRMGTHEYEAAAMRAPHPQRDLTDTPVTASWDNELSSTMHRYGFSIAEEAVSEPLMEDLARSV